MELELQMGQALSRGIVAVLSACNTLNDAALPD